MENNKMDINPGSASTFVNKLLFDHGGFCQNGKETVA